MWGEVTGVPRADEMVYWRVDWRAGPKGGSRAVDLAENLAAKKESLKA